MPVSLGPEPEPIVVPVNIPHRGIWEMWQQDKAEPECHVSLTLSLLRTLQTIIRQMAFPCKMFQWELLARVT